jgi:hypothetical protein
VRKKKEERKKKKKKNRRENKVRTCENLVLTELEIWEKEGEQSRKV